MKSVTLRPLAFFSISFYIMAAVLFYTKGPLLLPAVITVSITAALFLLLRKFSRKSVFVCIPLIALAAAMAFTEINTAVTSKLEKEYVGEHTATLYVREELYSKTFGGEYVTVVTNVNGKETKLKLHLKTDFQLQVGDTLAGNLEICPLGENSSLYEASYLYNYGVRLSASDVSLEYTGENESGFIEKLYKLNEKLTSRLVIMLGDENGGIAASLLLGNRSYLSDSFIFATKRLGLSHLIALSGMHLSVICAIISLMLSKTGAIAKRVSVLPLICLYALLTGLSASILRAAVMLLIMNLISLTGRKTDQPTNLGLTLIFITLFSPYAVCDIGLQLSSAAMLGVFATLYITTDKYYWLYPEKKLRHKIAELSTPFVMTFCAILFTSPVSALYFGSLSPMAFLTSVPFSFLVTIILWLSPFTLILGNVPFIGGILRFFLSKFCYAYSFLTEYAGKRYGYIIPLDTDTALIAILVCVFLFSLALVCDKKKTRRVFAFLTAAAVFLSAGAYTVSAYNAYVTPKIEAFETSLGDGMVVTHKDKRVLIDITRGSKGAYYDMLTLSWYYGDIDALIITDPHYAHANQINELSDCLNIQAVYMPETEDSAAILPIFEEKDLKVILYTQGDSLDFGYFTVDTFSDTYISRSVVPVVQFFVDTDGADLQYFGGAAEEAGIKIEAPENSYLWLGGYGPKYKKELSTTDFENVLVSTKAAEFCSESTDFANGNVLKLD